MKGEMPKTPKDKKLVRRALKKSPSKQKKVPLDVAAAAFDTDEKLQDHNLHVEMTSVGMVGVGPLGNSFAKDPEEPKPEKDKKKKNLAKKFISFELGKVK